MIKKSAKKATPWINENRLQFGFKRSSRPLRETHNNNKRRNWPKCYYSTCIRSSTARMKVERALQARLRGILKKRNNSSASWNNEAGTAQSFFFFRWDPPLGQTGETRSLPRNKREPRQRPEPVVKRSNECRCPTKDNGTGEDVRTKDHQIFTFALRMQDHSRPFVSACCTAQGSLSKAVFFAVARPSSAAF